MKTHLRWLDQKKNSTPRKCPDILKDAMQVASYLGKEVITGAVVSHPDISAGAVKSPGHLRSGGKMTVVAN